jgi:ribonuclease P protein component
MRGVEPHEENESQKDERFPRKERIVKRRDFERIFKVGKRKKASSLTFICCPFPKRRIAFVLTRRIKGSILRNRLKRRLRDIYRKNKSNFKGESVILAYPGAERLNYSELRETLLRLARQFK